MASIEGDDGLVSRGQVRFRVRRYASVVVAAEKILRHDLLTADRLVVERLDVTNLVERPVRDIDELSGMRAKRNLRKGTILTAAAVEPLPDVESGHRVTVVYDDGRCRVSAAGVALQSGVTGDYVKVKNESSGKIIVAKVVDESTVAIDP
jgi:flagella basal body P-ring formation protein FlgA